MNFKAKTRRLERLVAADRVGACSACGGRVTIIEYHDDGEASFPFEEPCELCEGDSGRVRFIEVMLGESDGD